MLRQRGRVGLMAAALVGMVVGSAGAQVTTEKSASILFFPKVISDGTRDTVIQITNTSNSMVHAHCFYVNGALTFPDLPPGPINPPLWTEVDFDIWLTRQQPTHWVVSEGRLVDPTDPPCNDSPENFDCDGAGIDPGRVPPVVEYFTGELKCVETTADGSPLSGNHLKGEATTIIADVCDPIADVCVLSGGACASNEDCDSELFDVAKYNAIGVLGNEFNDGNHILCLGGEPSEECPFGAEYDACPQFWIANHFADGAPSPFFEVDDDDSDSSAVFTAWTIVPCTENFETQAPESVTLFIQTFNEFEQQVSAFATVDCWGELGLSEIASTFTYSSLGTSFAQSRIRPTAQTRSGIIMVGTEAHVTEDGNASTADVNYHIEGARPGPDIITIPPEQAGPQ